MIRLVTLLMAWCALATLTGCASLSTRPATDVQADVSEFEYRETGDGFPTVRVLVVEPSDPDRPSPTLLVMTGMNRNADDYRADWIEVARRTNALVVVPEFSSDDFDETDYNLGGLVDGDGDPRETGERTFDLVKRIVRSAQQRAGIPAGPFRAFGHSAGAQFVHRMVMFAPEDVERAVAANAGWYTVTDDGVRFPYGLDGIPLDEDQLSPGFAVPLRIYLGEEDVDPDPGNLRTTSQARDQGANRLERGLHFMKLARLTAEDQGLPLAWGVVVVPGVGHDHTAMADAAAAYLLDD